MHNVATATPVINKAADFLAPIVTIEPTTVHTEGVLTAVPTETTMEPVFSDGTVIGDGDAPAQDPYDFGADADLDDDESDSDIDADDDDDLGDEGDEG